MMRTANLREMPMTGIMPDHKPTGYGRHARSNDCGDSNCPGYGDCDCPSDCDCKTDCACQPDG